MLIEVAARAIATEEVLKKRGQSPESNTGSNRLCNTCQVKIVNDGTGLFPSRRITESARTVLGVERHGAYRWTGAEIAGDAVETASARTARVW